jgi:hypothetical protein
MLMISTLTTASMMETLINWKRSFLMMIFMCSFQFVISYIKLSIHTTIYSNTATLTFFDASYKRYLKSVFFITNCQSVVRLAENSKQ